VSGLVSSAWPAWVAQLGQSPLGYILASILVLLPCYWQARIQAGDLSSHIYNSWLAQLAEAGKLPGLIVANQATNIRTVGCSTWASSIFIWAWV
jgi:hypothetical protein